MMVVDEQPWGCRQFKAYCSTMLHLLNYTTKRIRLKDDDTAMTLEYWYHTTLNVSSLCFATTVAFWMLFVLLRFIVSSS